MASQRIEGILNQIHNEGLNTIPLLDARKRKKDMADAEKRVTDYVNQVCKNILFNTAVFKPDENGKDGFVRFLNSNGIK